MSKDTKFLTENLYSLTEKNISLHEKPIILRIKTKIMQNNVVFLRENNPIIAYHLQLMLEEEGFIVIKIDKNEHFMILCQYYKPIFIIWNEDGQITKKQAQSLAAMRADSGIPLFAIKSLETKENNLLHDFMLYDKILYKPFSCVQLKHFLTHLPKISPSFSLPL